MRRAKVEPSSILFARVMYIMSVISIAVIIISGTAYLMGFRQYVSIESVTQHWNELADIFWKEVKGYEVTGYSWFLGNLSYSDSICILGIAMLATVPFVSLGAAIFRSDRYYRAIFLLLIVEFILAVVFK